MKKYLVKVDQDEFVVQIKLLGEEASADETKVAIKSSPEIKEIEQPSPTMQGETIEAPLGGTILKINVKTGDIVKVGEVLMSLEALKLENEITAPFAGRVLEILTHEGASVDIEAPLLVLEKQ